MAQDNRTSNNEIREGDLDAIEQRFPLSFSIFSLSRSHRALAAQRFREIDLFPGQELMLMRLWQQDGQSQSHLSRALCLDHSTVAKSIKRLADAGWVTRVRSPEDGRVTLVSLTEAGRALEPRVMDIWSRLERITSDALTEQEQTLFMEPLGKITLKVDS